jgi:hypothetical protein
VVREGADHEREVGGLENTRGGDKDDLVEEVGRDSSSSGEEVERCLSRLCSITALVEVERSGVDSDDFEVLKYNRQLFLH